MIKFYKQYESEASRIEVITIDDDTMIQENLFTDNKAVWKTYSKNIINDLKWKQVKDYIHWIKELGYKELKEYSDNLIWFNPNTKKDYKQYKFNIQ